MSSEKMQRIKETLKKVIPYIDSFPTGDFIPSSWQPPEGFINEKFKVGEIPVEHLIPKEKQTERIVLELHGGAYLLGLTDPWRDALVKYSHMAGDSEVYGVDYRLAPKYVYPAALEDAVKVYKWLLKKGVDNNNIILAGDSAGGNLTLALVLYLKDHKISLPKTVLVASPWTNAANDFPATKLNYDNDLTLGRHGFKMGDQLFNPLYFKGADVKKDPYVSPVLGDFKGFPSLLIQAGSHELLLDDARILAKRAKEAGVNVKLTVYEKMSHDFQMVLSDIEESKEAWEEMKMFVCGK